jgi:hypothetical protein
MREGIALSFGRRASPRGGDLPQFTSPSTSGNYVVLTRDGGDIKVQGSQPNGLEIRVPSTYSPTVTSGTVNGDTVSSIILELTF